MPSRVRPSFRPDESAISDSTLFTIVGDRETRPDPNARLIEIYRIHPDPRQPRKTFPKGTLDELAASIRSLGFLQPVVVRRDGDDFILISGERRFRAAQKLGLTEIPAVIKDYTADDALVAALVENLQRENLPPDEEAASFDEMLRSRGFGVRELARLIHKDPSYVSRRVRVYDDPVLGDACRSGKVAVSTAERILGVKNPEVREQLVERALRGDLDQRQARRIVREARQLPLPMVTVVEPPPAKLAPSRLTQQAIGAIQALIASNERPTAEERKQLRALDDRLLDWIYRFGPMPWS